MTSLTDMTEIAQQHYSAQGLTERIRDALSTVFQEDQQLTVADLAGLDHFHTRGMLATQELAGLTPIGPNTRVLDLGCGIGGPARFLAAKFGCEVTGVDLSAGFIDTARYLNDRCGVRERVSFQVGNALELDFEAARFDGVFLQHVAMNITDRAALYAEVARVLAPGGFLASYDVILKAGDVYYPTPWARNARASYLLTEDETRTALIKAGFMPRTWRDQSEVAKAWFARLSGAAASKGPSLALVLGDDFPVLTKNLGRNLAENRIGILCAVAERVNDLT